MSHEIPGYDGWKTSDAEHDEEVERVAKAEDLTRAMMADVDAIKDFLPDALESIANSLAEAIVDHDDARIGEVLRKYIREEVYDFAYFDQ